MDDFINTVDILGDETVLLSLIDRSITEYNDNVLTKLGDSAFRGCASLISVDIPNCEAFKAGVFAGCSSLVRVNLPKITGIGSEAFYNCNSLEIVYFPNVTSIDQMNTFSGCNKLRKVVLPSVTSIGNFVFPYCSALTYVECGSPDPVWIGGAQNFQISSLLDTFIVRSTSVSSLGGQVFNNCAIGNGTGYIYVPRNLIDSYKAATNWSAYADQFRALEDWTIDGTITGTFARFEVSYSLRRVRCDNGDTTIGRTYYATLESINSEPISEVIITMGGIDITDSVYNPETGEVSIDLVTGDITITATAPKSESGYAYLYALPEPKTFNGTSDFIDTGIKLFDTAKDFTIICVADFTKLDNAQKCLFHCMNEASLYPGLSVDGSGGVRLCYTGSSSIVQTISNRNDVKALAFRYKAGVLDAIRYVNAAGTVVNFSHNTAAKYTTVNQNLLLGAYQMTNGTKGRYYNGTINIFRVYEDHLTDDELAEELITAYEES